MANLNKVKKYHFIYKTTNLLNGKYYVGMHSTSNLNDGYLGSGKRLRYSIRKYGIENFKLEIIEWLASREELVEKEKQLVNEDLLKDEMCINLKPGGGGGFCNDEHKWKYILTGSKAGTSALIEKFKNQEFRENWGSVRKQAWENNTAENKAKIMKPLLEYRGTKHTKETIEKMKQQRKGLGAGSTNSQFGTRWITNGKENKKINKSDKLPAGWSLGRIVK
jgi:hypothetical protein